MIIQITPNYLVEMTLAEGMAYATQRIRFLEKDLGRLEAQLAEIGKHL